MTEAPMHPLRAHKIVAHLMPRGSDAARVACSIRISQCLECNGQSLPHQLSRCLWFSSEMPVPPHNPQAVCSSKNKSSTVHLRSSDKIGFLPGLHHSINLT